MNRLFYVMIAAIAAVAVNMTGLPQAGAGESLPIREGSTVTLLYQITVPGNEEFEVRDLSQFVQGRHQMLPALEKAMAGMKRGDKAQIDLTPDQGFGQYDPRKKTVVSANELPEGTKPGDVLEDQSGRHATVTQLSESGAVVDFNHPLAGKPLNVTLTVLEVDNPS
ncbi:putative Peptidyl-prolyl cis-trans isomerase [Nitrospira japonica]|uniref:Peptidyl-prolyl cis-trans isomerase n=1 Tax=Nitrospira japonica TaxID=1325564 RepID=A0A1W1I7T4_9BACT|nr:FKBP-type peptidyl-prolyl cis-trans isomerase [Nitrospira japonica]SLM48919.1 putative Peptidyl-prolyl cis-trans isomerase [Nitrospira japonica]